MQYNVQFFNQRLDTDCDSLVNFSGGFFPGTALLEIPKYGFDVNKLVIGKPADPMYESIAEQFMDPTTLNACIVLAAKAGWSGGIMGFQLPQANGTWMKMIVTDTELVGDTNSSHIATTFLSSSPMTSSQPASSRPSDVSATTSSTMARSTSGAQVSIDPSAPL